ncbi:MAG: hypothetical protein J6M18_02585 [Actinomycetaceae bacterium]|nr:hypothetical protein [Actinomycetaceae bacterium]
MLIDDYGNKIPSKADNLADMIAMTDIGGIGTLIYHTFRFKDYEYDEDHEGVTVLAPLVYGGMEPDIDRDNSLSGARLVEELYNLARRANSHDEEKTLDELIIEFCKTIAHPYNIDAVYEIITDENTVFDKHGQMITHEAMFSVDRFKRDLEFFYNGARFYFALRKIADGEDYDIKEISEDGRYFDGVTGLSGYPKVEVPDEKATINAEAETPEELIREMEQFNQKYEQFLEEHKDELYKYTKDAIDDFYQLRDRLLFLIPDFEMRLKVNPKTGNVVFAAEVHSIFDIAWYTLARYMADVQLVEEGTKELASPDGKVCVCRGCGRAFVRMPDQNRKLYCGDPECERMRSTMRTRRKRERDKLKATKEDTKRCTSKKPKDTSKKVSSPQAQSKRKSL